MEFIAAGFVLLRYGRQGSIRFVNQEKTMTSVSKLAFLAAIAVAGVTSPALAKSGANLHSAKVPARHSGRLFDMAPQSEPARNSDAPSATGGGSIGYNQMLYNW
jgi:hypothetical protein